MNATLFPVFLLQSDLTGGRIMVVMPMNEQQEAMPRIAGPVYAPPLAPPAPTASHTFLLAALWASTTLLALGAGYGMKWYEDFKQQRSFSQNVSPDGALTMPAEMTLSGTEPKKFEPETNGTYIQFVPLDKELTVVRTGPKSAFVWATKPGEWRLWACAAVGGQITPFQETKVVASDSEPKTAKRQ